MNMGCDFYIDKDLHIIDNNNRELSRINLEHEKGYYWFISILDEDEERYDDEVAQYKKQTLKPSMKPIVIYSNNTFHKLSYENKYKNVIETDIKRFNKTLNDVNKIIKIENRYERW
jgi:AAA15 family ATPase/GTPase